MVLEAAQRVREGLAELIRLVNSGGASTVDARRVLSESKSFAAQVAVLQADAAALVAAGEQHGDGGAGVLAQAAGLARRDAAVQVKTVEQLQSVPGLRAAVTGGEIPMANARALAQASQKTSAGQVRQDGDLLEKAASLSPEQFAREAGRWVAQRQDDGGEGEYRRQRARRRLSVWKDDADGMVHLRGELDPVAGAKLRARPLKEAEQLRRSDLGKPGEKRSLPQRLADALETLTATGSSGDGQRNGSRADITIVQHLSPEGDKAFAEIADGGVIPPSVLKEHFCNARIVGVVFSSDGLPLWRGSALPRPSKAQMDALIARYGGCGGCGQHTLVCQVHHIRPRSQGGPTNIDNLMPLCWGCHDNVHLHGWQVVPDGRGLHTIAPPERVRYGPARTPDPPPINDPPDSRGRRGPPRGQCQTDDLVIEPLCAIA
ncbi:MAG: DUF222 domain-containing protein [Acidimicrobiaceae bacterium]|nr:DUF222 domain-containing protein [Acidimicrobiaceae bacterium]MYE97466.1 DUF222 domain-containing protein [Acidimicrobiaceae bacterium]MYH43645.1 DUF222 domain-containing protein [Acidimicrobiaceae bacterium]MYI52804.1 DUF222 domain-containing protein [Acidimicrobiaceae bacterium]MYK74101.1 DUF222 domain-containing protein [Acidimicrobiaceae bacterium]